jgi:cold shock protein
MEHPEKELAESEKDLAASKKVLRVAKKKAKAAKGAKRERKQAKRVFEIDQGRRGPSRGAPRQIAEAGGGKRIPVLALSVDINHPPRAAIIR